MSRSLLTEPDALGSRRRARSEAHVDLTSAIDVVFLLLIFFVVTSTMTGQADVNVPYARHGAMVDLQGAILMTLKEPLVGEEASTLILGDGTGREADLDEARQWIEEQLAGEGKRDVILKGEEKVPHRDMLEVARMIGEIEGANLFVGVRETPNEEDLK